MPAGELVEPEQVLSGVPQQSRDLPRRLLQTLDHLAETLAGLSTVLGRGHLADRSLHDLLQLPACVPEHVAQEVHRAALPSCRQDSADPRSLAAGGRG